MVSTHFVNTTETLLNVLDGSGIFPLNTSAGIGLSKGKTPSIVVVVQDN